MWKSHNIAIAAVARVPGGGETLMADLIAHHVGITSGLRVSAIAGRQNWSKNG